MTGSPLVEPLPDRVAAAARDADLGTYRFAVTLESRRPAAGAGLMFVAMAVVCTPQSRLIGYTFFRDGRVPAVAWLVAVLAASPFVIAAVLLLRHPAPVLHCFDAGAVRAGRRSLDVRQWTAVAPYEWIPHGTTERRSELREPGRRFVAVPADDAEQVSALVAEWETPRARTRLAAGAPVTYGRITVTRDALLVDDEPAPWSAVREPVRTDDTLSLFVSDREPVRIPRRDVPHERSLLQLIREHRGI